MSPSSCRKCKKLGSGLIQRSSSSASNKGISGKRKEDLRGFESLVSLWKPRMGSRALAASRQELSEQALFPGPSGPTRKPRSKLIGKVMRPSQFESGWDLRNQSPETTYIPGCTQKAQCQRSFSSYHPWPLYYVSRLVLKLNSLGFSFVRKFREITRQDRDKRFWEASSSSFKIGPENWVCCEWDRGATIAQGMSMPCPAFEVFPLFTGEISPRKHCNHWFYLGTLLTLISSTVTVLNRNGTTVPLGDLGCI